MKNLYYTSAFIMTAVTAQAGGLSDPVVTPPVVSANPPSVSAWDGFYVGVSVGRTESTRKDEISYYQRACVPSPSGKWQGKCIVDQDDFMNSPELVALGDIVDGHPSKVGNLDDPFRYDAGYPGVWTTQTLYYTTTNDLGPDRPSRYADNVFIGKITEVFDVVESADSAGAFLGYRMHLAGPIVVGAELGADGTMTTGDVQVGLPAGRVLGYGFAGIGQYDGEDGTSYGLGADLRISGRVSVGGQYRLGEFGNTDTETLSARVSFSF